MNQLQIATKNLKVTEFGIEEVGSVTAEEIQSALKSVMKFDTMFQFYIGDLINIASYRWGEKYTEWEEATGYEYSTLTHFARTSSRFTPEFREYIFARASKNSNVVGFTHFNYAASLSDEKAIYFLEMVRDGKWSTRKLIEEIKRSKNGGTLPEPKTYELPDGFVSFKDAEIDVAGIVPVAKQVGSTKSVETNAVAMTNWEAKLVLELIGDNPRLLMLADRIERTFTT